MESGPEPTAGARARAGTHGTPATALIDESRCIGCTLCIQACPFDAIIGATRRMHTVVESWCTGCELCVAPCPVDCISMVAMPPGRGWTRAQTVAAGARVKARKRRLEREREERDARLAARARDDADPQPAADGSSRRGIERISAIAARAVQRARSRRSGTSR